VDVSKGCDTLVQHFMRYKAEYPGPLQLVLIGKVTMPLPDHPDIRPLGFMKDERFPWMQAARALVLPSAYESLSLVALEAWALGAPVLADARAEVVRGHCRRSNGGLYYGDYAEFAAALRLMETNAPLRQALGRNGAAYVQQHYNWAVVERAYLDWLGELSGRVG
jgi:glycosyltransferase involved in cell wall biosynthesis